MTSAAPSRDPTLEEAPWPSVAEKVGSITRVTTVGRMRSTFLLDTEIGKVVAKRMRNERDPERHLGVLGYVWKRPSPFCPRPLGAVIADVTCWYALFEWIDGAEPPFAPEDSESVWESTLGLLQRMRSTGFVPEWTLESLWLDRLDEALWDEPTASWLLSSLRRSMPEGPRTLAHGDFSLQNFVRAARGLVLIDWEEFGSALPGFDAGWMLALARMGAGLPRGHHDMLDGFCNAGFQRSNLIWFETLGILRMLFRARTLPMTEVLRQVLLSALRLMVHERAEEMGLSGAPNR